MSRYFIALLLPLFCFAAPQTPAPQAPEPVRFSSRAALVTVPVIVTKSGKVLTGLKKEDFAIEQDGQAQTVAQFEEVNTVAPVLPANAAPAPEPMEFSNLLPMAAPTRLTIIALDMVAGRFYKQQEAREKVIEYLKDNITAREPIALVAVTRGGIRVIHGFTTDPALLVAALAKAKVGAHGTTITTDATPAATSGAPATGPGDAVADTHVGAPANPGEMDLADYLTSLGPGGNLSANPIAQMQLEGIYFTSVDGIIALARAYADVPARKSLIWMSPVAPFQPLSPNGALKSNAERALLELKNANMAIYPIDITGLSTLFRRGPTTAQNIMLGGRVNGGRGGSNTRNPIEDASLSARTSELEGSSGSGMTPVDHMRWIADATGGRAIVNTNDFKGAITRAMDDSTHYYQLTYYLPKDTKPGWHKIKVKVYQSGVQVRTRSGVLVDEPGKAPDPRSDVTEALGSPLDLTGVPISLRWTGQFGNVGEPKKASFELSIPARGLQLDDRDGNHLSFTLTVLLRSPQTKGLGRFESTIERRLASDKLAEFTKVGFNMQSALNLPPGRYWVKFLVHDNLSGRVGTITAPLTVE